MTPQHQHLKRTPTIRVCCQVVSIFAIATFWTISANAATLGIPARFYPPGSHVAYYPTLSNHDLDCQWGFFCEGSVPLFHFQTQDQLHRIGGWAQYARWGRGHKEIEFALYASVYEGTTSVTDTVWAKAAFDDLRRVTHLTGYASLHSTIALLPSESQGGSVVELQHAGSEDLVVMAYWSGSHEVEAITTFAHQSASAQRVALRDLTGQVEVAMRFKNTASQSG